MSTACSGQPAPPPVVSRSAAARVRKPQRKAVRAEPSPRRQRVHASKPFAAPSAPKRSSSEDDCSFGSASPSLGLSGRRRVADAACRLTPPAAQQAPGTAADAVTERIVADRGPLDGPQPPTSTSRASRSPTRRSPTPSSSQPREILIDGKSAGHGQPDRLGRRRSARQYDLVVEPAITTLQQHLQTLFPGEDIHVGVDDDAIILSGQRLEQRT